MKWMPIRRSNEAGRVKIRGVPRQGVSGCNERMATNLEVLRNLLQPHHDLFKVVVLLLLQLDCKHLALHLEPVLVELLDLGDSLGDRRLERRSVARRVGRALGGIRLVLRPLKHGDLFEARHDVLLRCN